MSLMSRATGSTSGIKRKSPEAGHITLVFHMTGDGTISTHKKVMSEKSVLFGETIVGSSLWRSESAIAYNSFYLPSLGYGMCATTLALQECEDIQSPVINAILQKMGIHRKATRAVVFGTAKFGGLGLDNSSTIQGNSNLQYLLGSLGCGDHTGQLTRMLIEYTQLECHTIYWNKTTKNLANSSSTKIGSQKYGNIYTAVRPQSQCSKSGNHA
jgi:hypothetical protein